MYRKDPDHGYHSLSSIAAVIQALETDGFAGFVLFDHPVCPPDLNDVGLRNLKAVGPRLAALALKRKAHCEAVEELVEVYRNSRSFERLRPGVADLLARTTLGPTEDGGYELCCPPDHEAHVLDQLYKWQISLDLDTLGIPVKVIGSDPMVPFSLLPSIQVWLRR